MKKLWMVVVCSFALSLGLGMGCGSDDEDKDANSEETGEGLTPDCNAIRKACHKADEGTGPAHDCHEVAHDADPDTCTAELDSCLEACADL